MREGIHRSVLLLVLIGSLFLAAGADERVAENVAPDADSRSLQGGRPNVLFIMTDQQRFDAMSFAGQNRVLRTPNIDRLARQGVWFKNAYTSAPVCGPARTSLMTGLSIETTGVQVNNRPGNPNMVPYDKHLKDEGYATEYCKFTTSFFVKNQKRIEDLTFHFLPDGKWHAPNFLAGHYDNPIDLQSFNLFGPFRIFLFTKGYQFLPQLNIGGGLVEESMSGQPYRPNPIDSRFQSRTITSQGVCECDQYGVSTIPREDTLTAFEGRRTISAMRRLSQGNRPFSLHVSFNSPHGPHVVSEPFASMFNAANMPIPPSINDPLIDSPHFRAHRNVYANRNLVGHMIAVYYAQMAEVDLWLGRIMREMDTLGITNNTMVILTSDHGEMLGSHGMIEKSVLFEESAKVPLIIRYPNGIRPRRRVSIPVSHRDLFATILDYTRSRPKFSQGTSLRAIIEKRFRGVPYTVVESGELNQIMIRAGNFKLILPTRANAGVVNGMYNLKKDPYEMRNLIGPTFNRRRRWLPFARYLRRLLVQWCNRVNSPHTEQIRSRSI